MQKHQPKIFSEKNILIHASKEDIFSIIVDIKNWPKFFSHVQSTKVENTLKPGASFCWKSNGIKILSTCSNVTSNESISWTGKSLGIVAEHHWIIKETDDGTMLYTSESFDGWLTKIMPHYLQKTLDITLASWLAEIKIAVESK
jgi:hypothetical protein